MSIVEYDEIEIHRQRHRLFLEDIGHLMLQIPLGIKTHEDLAVLAGEWILEHEGTMDTYFAQYVERFH